MNEFCGMLNEVMTGGGLLVHVKLLEPRQGGGSSDNRVECVYSRRDLFVIKAAVPISSL